MDILFTLIPLSVALIFLVVAVLCWAVFSGQFEDLDAEAARVLADDFAAPAPPEPAVVPGDAAGVRRDPDAATDPRNAASVDLDQSGTHPAPPPFRLSPESAAPARPHQPSAALKNSP